MTLNKLMGLYYATDELLTDAAALGSIVEMAFAEEFAFMLDDGAIRGTGAGQMLGILNAACLVSVAKEAGQAADSVVPENIIKMWSRLWARSRPNAVWFINQDVEPKLHTMSITVGTGGVPVYMPAGGLSQSMYSTLFGRPVIPIEQCATVGDKGDIVLADMSQYLTAVKGGIQAAQSIHVQFLTDETAFRWVYRTDGQPWWKSALTPYKGSNSQSPFVTLDAR
jgi:HK97 family phage major capsid protein